MGEGGGEEGGREEGGGGRGEGGDHVRMREWHKFPPPPHSAVCFPCWSLDSDIPCQVQAVQAALVGRGGFQWGRVDRHSH